jgi:aldehyde dehydrogenase (NAD+)
LITPWNFPAAIPAWKAAPALAAGNAVVLKLSSRGALTGLRLTEALCAAGLPAGALNVLFDDGPDASRALVRHGGVDAVSFTGSTAVGRDVVAAAAARGARVQAEMGGHAPLVVLADADLPAAIGAAVAGAFSSAGQKCTATRRIYVAQERYDAFLDGLLERTAALRVGPADDRQTTLGPLVERAARDRVQTAVAEAAQAGELRCGGVPPADPALAAGAFLLPAVLTDLPPDATLASTEVFGPAVAVWPIRPGEDPIELANRTDYGLAASIYTNDLAAAQRFARRVRAGIVHVNSPTAGADVHVPFGGHWASGYGIREQGREAAAFYTQDRTVYLDLAG